MRRAFGNNGYFDGQKLPLEIINNVIAVLLHDGERFAVLVSCLKKRINWAALAAVAG